MAAVSRRDHLVDTALSLFYREGFHATGIDRILSEAGVAKMTLYNHFRSKEDLIVATLQLRDERFRAWLMDAVDKKAKKPHKRLLALFDALEDHVSKRDFSGCMFVNAAAEYAPRKDPVHKVSANHKKLMLDYITGLAKEAGAKKSADLARQLLVLMDGAMVGAQVSGPADAVGAARQVARGLIDKAVGKS